MKINTKHIIIMLIAVLFSSCNKYEVTEDNNISIETLSVSNIDTKLAVININVNQEEFDNMMQNYNNDIEISANLCMYMGDKVIINNEDAEIEIKGSATAAFPLKSIKVKFENDLDNSNGSILNVEKHISTHDLNIIRVFSLRNSGNDFYHSYIKDASYSQMASDMGLDFELSYDRPVQVFINESFYGLLHLRTEKNKTALSKLLGVEKGDLNIIKINHLGDGVEEIEYKDGNKAILEELVNAAKAHNTEKLKEIVDIQCFADYIAYQDYIGNSDWPFNNVEIYNVADGKFRFYLYDLDLAGTRDKFFVLDDNTKGLLYDMYLGLEKDSQVKALLKQSQKDIVNYCSKGRFEEIVYNHANNIEQDIVYNITKYKVPENHATWYWEIEKVLEQFEMRRKSYKKYYDL